MTKRNRMRPTRVNAKRQESRPARLRTYSLMFACAVTLLCGFFFAARQHFSSMDFGMKNSRLRKQVDDLEAEKRRLLLAREVSLSPVEIKKALKRTGLASPEKTEGLVAQVVSTTKEKALPPPVSDSKSMVIKTASVTPARATTAVNYTKTDKVAKKSKTNVSND